MDTFLLVSTTIAITITINPVVVVVMIILIVIFTSRFMFAGFVSPVKNQEASS